MVMAASPLAMNSLPLEGKVPRRGGYGTGGMKESEEENLKPTIYDRTLSTAGAVPLPQWGRQRNGSASSPTCQSEYTQGNTLPLLYIELRERKKSDLLPLEKSHFPITKTQHAVSQCPWKYSLQSGTSAFHGSCRTSTAKLRSRETLRILRSALAHKVPHQPR